MKQGSTVTGDVAVAGGQLILAGTVEGSAAVLGGTAVLADTAVIEGDFASFGGTVEMAPGAIIEGESFGGLRSDRPSAGDSRVAQRCPKFPSQWSDHDPLGTSAEIISWQFATLGWALMMLLLGVIALVVAPKPMSRIANAAATQPALSFGAGLLTFVVGILAGILLLIACCLGVFVWLALLIAIAVGWIAVGLWVGQRLLAGLKVRNTSVLVEVGPGDCPDHHSWAAACCLGGLVHGNRRVDRSGRSGADPLRPPTVSFLAEAVHLRQSQSLEELDAEVLAPLALPWLGRRPSCRSLRRLPRVPILRSSQELLPASEPVVEPRAEPFDGAPRLPEEPADAIVVGPSG